MIERLHVKITFADRDSNKGAITICLPYATGFTEAYAYASALRIGAAALSNAIVAEVKLTYSSRVETLETVPGMSKAQERALIFYSNDNDVIHTISVPCARPDIWMTSGVYRDQIIDPGITGYNALVIALEAVASACIYADGQSIPSSYITIARCE